MNRKTVFIFIFLIILVVATMGGKTLLLSKTPYVRLGAAPPLTGAISQSLGTSDFGKTLSTAGKDYTIKDTHYLDDRAWVVVKLSSAKRNSEAATIVMQKAGSTYHIVLGPGTAFSIVDTQSLPRDVIQYLRQTGVIIYEP